MSDEQKKNFAKQLYESGNLTNVDIAKKIDVDVSTIKRWAKTGKWVNQSKAMELDDIVNFSNGLQSVASEKRMGILEKFEPIFELAADNLKEKLLQEKTTKEFSNIRDYAGLIGKVAEVCGKITGETTGAEREQSQLKRDFLQNLQRVSKAIEDKVSGGKLAGASNIIELDQFTTKIIE